MLGVWMLQRGNSGDGCVLASTLCKHDLRKGYLRDLRAKLLVACLVTPALWLNLSDSRNILIIHFGLLLKERTLDSIGHDL